MDLDWQALPSTFLTREVGLLTAMVQQVEAELESFPAALRSGCPAVVMVASRLVSPPDVSSHCVLTWLGVEGGQTVEALDRLVSELTPDRLSNVSISELAPYLLEPVEGSYRLRRGVVAPVSGREARRRLATYFTPPDVARSMVVKAIATRGEVPDQFLDPCCGTGIFLRELVREVKGVDPERLLESIRAFDLDSRNLDAAAVVLAFELFGDVRRWSDVRGRMTLGDARQLGREERFRGKFDLVIANPPYGMGSDSLDRAADFLDLLPVLVSQSGLGVMIVPSSVATASSGAMAHARAKLLAEGGEWSFYNFDRSPDSLFGDDIKQRCTIVTFSPSTRLSVRTSRMVRWDRSRRSEALDLAGRTTVQLEQDPSRSIPLISTVSERDAVARFQAIQSHSVKIGRLKEDMESAIPGIVVGNVAYDRIPSWLMDGDNTSALLGKRVMTFNTQVESLALYAILVSRVGQWYWRATDDGFHVSTRYLRVLASYLIELDQPALSKLADYGAHFWNAALLVPRRSVNAGVTTVSFAPPRELVALSEVDTTILSELGMSTERVEQLLDTFRVGLDFTRER